MEVNGRIPNAWKMAQQLLCMQTPLGLRLKGFGLVMGCGALEENDLWESKAVKILRQVVMY